MGQAANEASLCFDRQEFRIRSTVQHQTCQRPTINSAGVNIDARDQMFQQVVASMNIADGVGELRRYGRQLPI